MGSRYALSIDVGTSSVKASVIDSEGNLCSYSRVPLESFYEQLDPALSWERALLQAVSRLQGVSRIDAVCVTGNGPTLVPVDEHFRPAAPAISWLTTPSTPIEGVRSLYLPRLVHAIHTDEHLLEKTRWFAGCPEYVSALLSGELFTFLPHAAFAPFIWDTAQLEACSIPQEKLPPFIEAGERAGKVTHAAAIAYGIPAGTPIFAGLIDFHAALIGSGVVTEGMTCDRAGTSEGINLILRDHRSHPGLRTLPNIIDGTWTLAGLLPASGEVFEWYRSNSGLADLSYEQITRQITMSIPQHDYFFYPAGDTHAALQDGFVGGVFTDGNSCSDDPAQRGRAVAEGLGFSVRRVLEQFSAAGHQVSSVRHCGGQARSFHWNYMKAQILRIPIEVPRIIDAELLGCAMLCFCGLNLYDDVPGAAEDLVHIDRVYSPIRRTAIHYESQYLEWKDRLGLNPYT
ncbi:MAG: FGGY-family carbohydrate kinase [Spirochaetia bacterium]|nr:FGGY-family carbohydrate kinase [Spirochaetia bacterium]MCF7941749.1 FGGY-family carbohydrate kinase [Spirochaetia bacterium]